jgi:hypothetical protein
MNVQTSVICKFRALPTVGHVLPLAADGTAKLQSRKEAWQEEGRAVRAVVGRSGLEAQVIWPFSIFRSTRHAVQ